MAALTTYAVRQRVAAVVEALASPVAWRESRWSYDLLPVAEPQPAAHLTFAVAIPQTAYDSPLESVRHKRPEGSAAVTSEVAIRWLYRLRADAQVADYDAALTAEQTLLTALSGAALTDLHFSIADVRRSTVGDGAWMLGEVRCIARHRIANT